MAKRRPRNSEMYAIKYDARGIIETLEQDHHTDLALHLYSCHLLRRLSYTSLEAPQDPDTVDNEVTNGTHTGERRGKNRKKPTRQRLPFEKIQTQGQLYMYSFPRPEWAEWPQIRQSMPTDVKDDLPLHGASMPRTKNIYTGTDNPRGNLLLEPLPLSLGRTIFGYEVGYEKKHKRFQRAAAILLFETDASFQREVHKQVHKAKKQPMISSTPSLPLQSSDKLLEFVNSILVRLTQQRRDTASQPGGSIVKLSWQDVVSKEPQTGNALGRCKRLFCNESSAGVAELKEWDSQFDNILSSEVSAAQIFRKNCISNEELLANMRVMDVIEQVGSATVSTDEQVEATKRRKLNKSHKS